MKRLLVSCVCAALVLLAAAQHASRKAYCEVVVWTGQSAMLKAVVTFDFGMQSHPTAMLYDSKGQPMKFVSGMDAVNHLAQRGWELVATYYKTDGQQPSTHYVMSKTVTSDSQVTKGLVLKPSTTKSGNGVLPPQFSE